MAVASMFASFKRPPASNFSIRGFSRGYSLLTGFGCKIINENKLNLGFFV